jgi:hypothetical protein
MYSIPETLQVVKVLSFYILLIILLLHGRYSPEWALASLTFFEGFVTMIVLQVGVVNPTPNP